MSITIKTEKEIRIMREGGKRLAAAMQEVVRRVQPGVLVDELDTYAETLVREHDAIPAFLNYTPHGAPRPYPATLCVSINEEVVHGIPTEDPKTLTDGDIVTLDMGLSYQGLFVDMAHTVLVGNVDTTTKRLYDVALKAREIAIAQALPGNTTGDIGHAVESYVSSQGFSVPTELGGHGVGHAVHEDPFVPNAGMPGTGTELTSGMTLAIEPIVMAGSGAVTLLEDGYTFISQDNKRSAQFEHTILITNAEPDILTMS